MKRRDILPVNIGNPEERSIKTFATLIREMVGSGSEIVNRPEVEDDPQKRRPDISTAAKVLSSPGPKPLSPKPNTKGLCQHLGLTNSAQDGPYACLPCR